jgi:hypothetical protein
LVPDGIAVEEKPAAEFDIFFLGSPHVALHGHRGESGGVQAVVEVKVKLGIEEGESVDELPSEGIAPHKREFWGLQCPHFDNVAGAEQQLDRWGESSDGG